VQPCAPIPANSRSLEVCVPAHDAILAFVGRLAVAGRLPVEPDALISALVAAGFDGADVVAALEAAGVPPLNEEPSAPEPRRSEVPILDLSDDASSFLVGLRDLGYLTADMEDHVLDLLLDEVSADGVVGLPGLRRAVASVLFERQSELDPETLRFLDEEWRIAFH